MNSENKLVIKSSIDNIIRNIKNSTNDLYLQNTKIEINHHILLDYYNLISEHILDKNSIMYILHIISREINKSLSLREKQLLLSLLPKFFIPFLSTDITLTYPYLSRILTSIQSNILSGIPEIYIGEIFKEIIYYLFNDEEGKARNPINKELFEICQGFCFYNIKLKNNNNQLVGIICLNILLTEINYSFLNINNFVFYIWDKLLIYLDSSAFYPKSHLLKYIYDFISKFKVPFKPFVNIAIYKILEYIGINDTSIRKASLNILGLLISFYPKEIEPIKNSIMKLLVILHNDNDGNIRNKSIYIYNKIKSQYNSSHSINPSKRKKNNLYFYDFGYDNWFNKKAYNSNRYTENLGHRRFMSRNQTSASFFLYRDSIRRKTIDSEPLISKSEMGEMPKFSTKRKNENEIRSNYTNIRSVNHDDIDDNSSNSNSIGFRELLNMVKRKSDNKCKIDDDFAGLMDTVKKNKNGFLKMRKIKNEKSRINDD